jgi:hypothetical protein
LGLRSRERKGDGEKHEFFFRGEEKKGRRRQRRKQKADLLRDACDLRLHRVVQLLVLVLPEGDEDGVHAPVDCWSFCFVFLFLELE